MLKQLANMTTEKLIEMFELTTNMNDENIPTVRGWLMDEIEKRNPDGFDKWLDSEDPEYLREKMREEAEELLAGFQNSSTTFEVENIEETGTKYEVEGKYGDMVKLYITEHEVEGGEKSGKQYFMPENEKGC